MATLTITTKYSDEAPIPDFYTFEVTGIDEHDPYKHKQLSRLRFTYCAETRSWWKRRHAEGCGWKARQALIDKLRQIEPGLVIENRRTQI